MSNITLNQALTNSKAQLRDFIASCVLANSYPSAEEIALEISSMTKSRQAVANLRVLRSLTSLNDGQRSDLIRGYTDGLTFDTKEVRADFIAGKFITDMQTLQRVTSNHALMGIIEAKLQEAKEASETSETSETNVA